MQVENRFVSVGCWLLVVGKTGWKRNAYYLRIPCILEEYHGIFICLGCWFSLLRPAIPKRERDNVEKSFIAVQMKEALNSPPKLIDAVLEVQHSHVRLPA
jgi:hypothetical protein